MNLDEARKILSEWLGRDCNQWDSAERSHGLLWSGNQFIAWYATDDDATLDGEFTPDQLEAIAVWMRAHHLEGDDAKD